MDKKKNGSQKSRESEMRRMKHELEMMAVSDLATFLEHLREPGEDTKDAIQYKEFETDKKRWMLSALYNMDTSVKEAVSSHLPPQQPGAERRKVLVLHESDGENPYPRRN